jgi:antirestriction protein ArdC
MTTYRANETSQESLKQDLYTRVTAQIIADLERGTRPWVKPWNAEHAIEAFVDAESYYATLAQEATHWTKHPSRLAREFGRKKWGDDGYAEEELVAELGAAFLCADLELTLQPREDHAAYIASWLTVLHNDKRAIFRAAAHAQRAADYLHALQPPATECAA